MPQGGHGAVARSDYLRPLELAYEGVKVTKRLPAAIEAPHVDIRLNAQASRFVVFGTERDLLRTHRIGDKDFGLGRVAIRSEAVPALEYELARLGVHEASVFPDLDGLGRYVCDSWASA